MIILGVNDNGSYSTIMYDYLEIPLPIGLTFRFSSRFALKFVDIISLKPG